MGHFLYAAKAFDVLERLDPDPEYWEGKRGACVGVFQQVIAGKASKEDLQDALTMVSDTYPRSMNHLKLRVGAEYVQPAGRVHRAHYQEMVQGDECEDQLIDK